MLLVSCCSSPVGEGWQKDGARQEGVQDKVASLGLRASCWSWQGCGGGGRRRSRAQYLVCGFPWSHTHLFPFPGDVVLRARPDGAPLRSFSLPRGGCWLWQSCGAGLCSESLPAASLPPSGLVTDYLGPQVEEAGAPGHWARPCPAPAGWFQEVLLAFRLGRKRRSGGEKQHQPQPGLGEQEDDVHLSQEEIRRGGSSAGSSASQLGV